MLLDEDFLIVATFNPEETKCREAPARRGVKKRWSYEDSQTVEVSNGVKRFALKLFSTL